MITDKHLICISTIAAAVSAIAALCAIWQTRSAWRETTYSNRPYFTIKEPGIKPLPESPPYRIQITLINTGVRVATELSGEIVIIDKSLKGEPTKFIEFSVANDISPNTPTSYYNDTLIVSNNIPPQYILLCIKYKDPVIRKYFTQVFFMKWDGTKDGITNPDFTHASVDEKKEISKVSKGLLERYIK